MAVPAAQVLSILTTMSVKPFSNHDLNFLKFAAIVFDEFPKAMRHTFVTMWDKKIGVLPGYQLWDDSPAVRNMLLVAEGGKTNISTNLSIDSWDCTMLFTATIFAKTFAQSGSKKTLAELYINGKKPKHVPFHPTIVSPSGNQDETSALAIDQLRLLRNTLCHSAERNFDKLSFDHYVNLAKDAFRALNVSTNFIDSIGRMDESDFPTEKVDELNIKIDELTAKIDELNERNQFVQQEVIDVGNQLIASVGEVRELTKTIPALHGKMEVVNSRLMQVLETGNVKS